MDTTTGVPFRGWEVIKRYVGMGLGISIVTGICPTGEEKPAAIPFNRYFPKRTYGIVQHKGKLLAPPAARFVELIKARARPERRKGSGPSTSSNGA